MNIDILNKKSQEVSSNNSENSVKRLNGINSFAFELEFPESSSFAELMKMIENPEEEKEEINLLSDKLANKNDPQLLKKLKYLALKDQIPFKTRDIKDIRLLIHTQNLLDKSERFRINFDSFDDKDITFLRQLADNPNIVMNYINNQQADIAISETSGPASYQSLNVSKGLINIIEYAHKTQKPVRLDFEGDSSVILRINKEGKLSAEFMSSNKAMEYILKNSIPNLRNRLDSEGIPYKEIIYRDRNKKDNSRNNEGS